jgi:pyruvate dehydrogenase E2 component (dihydrolipoamide acetyltransferase)
MTINILMPALSPTMTEGTLAKWLVKEGDEVGAGDLLAEIETDKATMEMEAVDEGKVGKLLVAEGTEAVPVNAPIAVLLEEGEDASALEAPAAPAPTPAPTAPTPTPAPTPAPTAPTPMPAPTPAPTAAAPVALAPAPAAAMGERVFASPLAKRMAKQAGLDLAALKGSGPHGRVVKRDIEAALAGGVPAPAVAAAAPAAAPVAVPGGPSAAQLADLLGMTYALQPHSNMRKTIARRLSEAKQTVPHFYLTMDCEIDELLKVRRELNDRADELKISVNDFVIRAAALTLKQVPGANASWDETGILLYEHADVSVAVATPGGLITPIIKAAETKGLAAISAEMRDLAGRAREGKLKPEEYQGGSFSVSNLGMFGVTDFAAIINPPQGCILAVGAGQERPVVKDGALAVATVMSCTLSVDHRVVDGALGAEFLAAFKKLIEYPPAMLL